MNPEVRSLHYDSRTVTAGGLFFAVGGEHSDGHDYLPQALDKGAVAVASQRPGPPSRPVPWLQVEAIRPYMALAAHEFFGRPSQQLDLIGVTGTNGKTTTAYLVHSILSHQAPALLTGTVETLIDRQVQPSRHTTPEAIDLQHILREACSRGCRWGAMEVSSHALAFDRALHCRFKVGVFTNFSQDHLDFHGDMEAYFQAKCRLFDRTYNPGLETAVLNRDDSFCRRIPLDRGIEIAQFSLQPGTDAYPDQLHQSLEGTRMTVVLGPDRAEVSSPLVGRHNVENILAAMLACRKLGLTPESIASGVARLKSVPGRFERVELDRPYAVFVDYAHTPNALENVLKLGRQLTPGRVICVFGCGGDRDRSKRPQMGRIATRLSDHTIITSDNPRSEDPAVIVREIENGVEAGASYRTVVDRREAIALALAEAQPGDLVLIAGKGHETYQEIRGQKLPFDDRLVVREVA